MKNLILLATSEAMTDTIDNMDLSTRAFMDLLEIFVTEDWKNHETYNSFIRGFGNSFDKFGARDSVRFVQNLVEAGLNQLDILEAVIDKINKQESAIDERLIKDVLYTTL